MKKIKNLSKKLITCVSNRFNDIKKIAKNINKPSYANFIYIAYFYLIATAILVPIFFFITRKYKVNSGNLPFDIYLALSTLMIPLAIFVAQKVSDSKDFLIANVYMNQSHIFPMTIFQIVSFVSLFYIQNLIYYWILIVTYAILIGIIYIKTLRLFSDSIYFTKKLKEESRKIINESLNVHIYSAENIVQNKNFSECGIYFENYHYENTDMYKSEYINPPDENLLIKELSKRELNSLRSIMSQINNIKTEEVCGENSKFEITRKKIIVFLQSEGYTTRKGIPIAKIFYDNTGKEVIDNLDNIKSILDNLYKYEDYNLDIIVKKEIQEVENKCTISICNHSITELENNLKVYVDFYKAIVDNISSNIDKNYTLEQVYKSTHSIYTFRGFKYFDYIRREIYNLCYHPNSLQNELIFNEITSCIYEMLLYSYKKYELISFEYISNMYQSLTYLVNENRKLDMNKIQLKLFEILNYIYYELKNARNENYQVSRDMIILLNKVIVNIMFQLAIKDVERYSMFRRKFVKFISNLEQEIIQIIDPQRILETLQEILMHCSSNLFAMDSYLFEKQKNDISTDIIEFYNNKSFKYIIDAFLNAHKLDFDSIYNWDSWENYDILNQDEAHFVNTGSYMNKLFCNICIKHNHIELPIDRDLVSFYKSSLKNTFISLGCNEESDLILKFENMLKKYDENGKRYLRETNISEEKRIEFIKKFLECYNRDNNLYNIMKKYGNTKIVKPSKGEKSYLGISQILEKTFLLDKMPNNENIVFMDFEANFVESFINGEEKRYVKDILKKLPILNDDIIKVLADIDNIGNFIIFANYSFDYKLYGKIDIRYEYNEQYKSIDENNNLYVLYKDILIPIYQIKGLDNKCFYIININKMGNFCREKDANYFDIQIFEYSNDEKHLQKTMNEKINGCDLQGEEKRKYLLESVNLVIKEYVKFECNQVEGYKLSYKESNIKSGGKEND